MAEWKYHDEHWLIWEERLPDGKWFLCFKRPEGYKLGSYKAVAWVNVLKDRWVPAVHKSDQEIEAYELKEPMGELELLCVMHEMRSKHGELT